MAYIVEHGDDLSIISTVTGTLPSFIKMYHNLRSSEYIANDLNPGTLLILPPEAENKLAAYKKNTNSTSKTENQFNTETTGQSVNLNNDNSSLSSKNVKSNTTEEAKKEGEKEENNDVPTTEHDGKLFIIQKGQAQCNQGNMKPKFVVQSHKRLYLNLSNTTPDSLMVMDSDTTFMPAGPSFGQCKLKPTSGGYLPCSCSPAGKWQKTYTDTTVDGNKAITEMSELMCTIGGKITVSKHGQVSQMSQRNVENVNPKAIKTYNPVVDFEDFKSGLNDDIEYN